MSSSLSVANAHPSSVGNAFEAEASRDQIELLIKSGSLPNYIQNFEQAFVIAKMGKDIGFSPTQSFQYIVNVQGTLTINAKGIGILLKREGYLFKVINDGAWVLEDRSIEKIIDRVVKDNKTYDSITGKRILDRVTTLAYRKVHQNSGYVEEGSTDYYFSDAITAGLTNKDVWKKYPKAMMLNRAKTKLASELGLLFLPETEEIAMVQNVDVVIDSEGNVLPKN